jgi:integrase
MAEGPSEFWRSRAAVSEALDAFRSGYIQDVWGKALARQGDDPEGAVTSARTLLESVCKFILEEAGKQYRTGLSLPELYKLTRSVLELAPDKDTAPILNKLFEACTEIITNLGMLRNYLSDAHGRGRFGSMPDWRHAELAVNLSGAMATYLAAVWKGREPTVRDVLLHFVEGQELGSTHAYALKALAEREIGKLAASKLEVGDLIAHCQSRLDSGIQPQTVQQDLTYLRGAIGEAKAAVFERAFKVARAANMISKSSTRSRRVTDEEIDALAQHYEQQEKHWGTKVPMRVLMYFAVWSGRRIGEIVELRWDGVDIKSHTCKVPGQDKDFLLLERAWDIVLERSQKKPRDDDTLIFPYRGATASARSTSAKKKLTANMPGIADLRFNDLRLEAVHRLLEKDHPPHTVSQATGVDVRIVTKLHNEKRRQADNLSRADDE